MAQSPYYAGVEWPAYVFREYPKMVNGVIVQHADEEAVALAAPVVPAVDPRDAEIAALRAQLAAQVALDVAKADAADVAAEVAPKRATLKLGQ